MNCPLCKCIEKTHLLTKESGQIYWDCTQCRMIWLENTFHLNPIEEKKRYLSHNNDIHDPRYQDFVKPLYEIITKNHDQFSIGLDYGAGTGPVLASLLTNSGYKIDLYDLYFYNDPTVFSKKYDFIFACEVVEHFYYPAEEFKKIRAMINPKGTFSIMTSIFDNKIDFKSWYYHNDPTHVCFYRAETLEWMKNEYHFSSIELKDNRQVVFYL